MQDRINGTTQLEARTGAGLISSKTSPGEMMMFVRLSVTEDGSDAASSGGGGGIGAASIEILLRCFYHVGPPTQYILQAKSRVFARGHVILRRNRCGKDYEDRSCGRLHFRRGGGRSSKRIARSTVNCLNRI